jgi:hypothetical protein
MNKWFTHIMLYIFKIIYTFIIPMYTGKVVLKDGNLDLERVTVAAYSGFKSSKI